MISFLQYLLEERAKVVQRQSAYDILKEYKDDPNIYISFTDIDKLGINPQSGYNTPLGIYTYPLKEIWKSFNHSTETIHVPFKGNADYIWIVKQSCSNFVEDLYHIFEDSALV